MIFLHVFCAPPRVTEKLKTRMLNNMEFTFTPRHEITLYQFNLSYQIHGTHLSIYNKFRLLIRMQLTFRYKSFRVKKMLSAVNPSTSIRYDIIGDATLTRRYRMFTETLKCLQKTIPQKRSFPERR